MKTIIIDDEHKAAKMLEIELQNLNSSLEIIGNYQNPELGIKAINEHKPDLLFLDIEMPRMSGFDVLQAINSDKLQIIFVTAYSDFALQAIKANALDYILKPIDSAELSEAVRKAQLQHETNNTQQLQFLLQKLEQQGDQSIKIPSNDQILFFQPEDIIYCQAESNYTQVVTSEKKILISKTLKHMEAMLPEKHFIRIHQSYIVNRKHIKAYSRLDGGYVILSNGDKARVAKHKKKLVL